MQPLTSALTEDVELTRARLMLDELNATGSIRVRTPAGFEFTIEQKLDSPYEKLTILRAVGGEFMTWQLFHPDEALEWLANLEPVTA